MHVAPVIVEELQRESLSLPEKDVEDDLSATVPGRILCGSHDSS
jgi:hypothetical protein